VNILILTAYTDNIRWNNYGKCDYGDYASTNHLDYSNLHGYTYLKKIVKDDDFSDIHPTWIKIKSIINELPNYDYVVWIDADAVFVDKNLKIEDLINNQADLTIPKHEEDENTGIVWTGLTTGFMIWKNSEWSINFLKNMWENPGKYRWESFHEQSMMDELLYDSLVKNNVNNILNKSKEDLAEPILSDNIWILPKSYHKCSFGNIKFIYHAGGDTPSKLKRIKSVLS
jgi:hypothetical protein